MKGPRYIITDPLQLYWQEKELRKHSQRINQIVNENHRSKIEKTTKKDDLIKESLFKNKLCSFLFSRNEKTQQIDKENQTLLNKMLGIQNYQHFPIPQMKEKPIRLPMSLNLVSRKQNAEKIERENFSFAKRLAKPYGFFNKTQRKKEIDTYLKLRKHMTKMSFFPEIRKNSSSSLHDSSKPSVDVLSKKPLFTEIPSN